MTLNNSPFGLDDVDPDKDFFRTKNVESDTDDVNTSLVPASAVQPGDIWYVRAVFGGYGSAGTDDFNDGFLTIQDGVGFGETPDESNVVASRLIEDSPMADVDVETYVQGSDITDGNDIGIGLIFPAAAFDYYGNLVIFGEAVRVRRGHEMAPKAFSPNQTVQTFDGTTDLTASFSSPTMRTDGDGTGYCHVDDSDGDGATDTASYAAEVPEYTNADNPTFSFEIRNTDNSGINPSSWPSTYTQLDETGTLPQSDNQSSWPLIAYLPDNQELPEPSGGTNQGSVHYYEARMVIWEAANKSNTLTYSSDTWEFSFSDPPDSLQ